MDKLKNGQYIAMNGEGRVVQYLSNHEEAVNYMMSYYNHNKDSRPDLYLLQVQAKLEYAPPTIKTLAHEAIV